jgi:7,8-dihydropterin-6-yl-methyl-4-(beta-D-ribofuranosyl)aminobenzene 5'-phosphate synthase
LDCFTSTLSARKENLKNTFSVIFSMILISLCACTPIEGRIAENVSPVSSPSVIMVLPSPTSSLPATSELATPSIASITPVVPDKDPAQIQPSSPIIETNEREQPSTPPITQTIIITVLYDNHPGDPQLASAWGFSVLIEYGDYTVLFDTGGDGKLLLQNMRILGVDPEQIDSVVLSHAHEDHTGGMIPLLAAGIKPVVYLLPSFPLSFKRQVEQFTQVIDVTPWQSITEGIWTTGEMPGVIPEQSLVLQTSQGLVIITGCAHPGIIAIIEKVHDLTNQPIHLVMGGFHLSDKSQAEIAGIITDFRRLAVEQVAPCHCTGESAIASFSGEYENDFIQVVVGTILLEKQ